MLPGTKSPDSMTWVTERIMEIQRPPSMPLPAHFNGVRSGLARPNYQSTGLRLKKKKNQHGGVTPPTSHQPTQSQGRKSIARTIMATSPLAPCSAFNGGDWSDPCVTHVQLVARGYEAAGNIASFRIPRSCEIWDPFLRCRRATSCSLLPVFGLRQRVVIGQERGGQCTIR